MILGIQAIRRQEIRERCGKPLYKKGEFHRFAFRTEGGVIRGEGVIKARRANLEASTWSYRICGFWLDQEIINCTGSGEELDYLMVRPE